MACDGWPCRYRAAARLVLYCFGLMHGCGVRCLFVGYDRGVCVLWVRRLVVLGGCYLEGVAFMPLCGCIRQYISAVCVCWLVDVCVVRCWSASLDALFGLWMCCCRLRMLAQYQIIDAERVQI